MVMMIEPIDKCISALKEERTYDEIIYMTPDGVTLNQKTANILSLKENIIILCGHYKGVDQRVRDHFITREISIREIMSFPEVNLVQQYSVTPSYDYSLVYLMMKLQP